MAIPGDLEEAKVAAQRTLIPGTESAGAGQDDIATTAFPAWSKEARAGKCLDAALAMLAMMASQALHVTGREAPGPLQDFVADVRRLVPPVDADRVLGPELQALAGWFTERVFALPIDPWARVGGRTALTGLAALVASPDSLRERATG